MQPTRKDSLLARLMAARGVTKSRLNAITHVSDSTMRAAEADPRSVRDSTWRVLLGSLAGLGQLTQDEITEITAATEFSTEALQTINATAVTSPPGSMSVTDPLYVRWMACLARAEALDVVPGIVQIAEIFLANCQGRNDTSDAFTRGSRALYDGVPRPGKEG